MQEDIQDRDGAPDLFASTAISHPWLSHILADGGYGGGKRRGALDKIGGWTIKSAVAWIAIASIRLMIRRLARA